MSRIANNQEKVAIKELRRAKITKKMRDEKYVNGAKYWKSSRKYIVLKNQRIDLPTTLSHFPSLTSKPLSITTFLPNIQKPSILFIAFSMQIFVELDWYRAL